MVLNTLALKIKNILNCQKETLAFETEKLAWHWNKKIKQ